MRLRERVGNILRIRRVSVELGMIGLGRMGANMVKRLIKGGHRVVGYARTAESVDKVVQLGAEGAYSLEELVSNLSPRRVI